MEALYIFAYDRNFKKLKETTNDDVLSFKIYTLIL